MRWSESRKVEIIRGVSHIRSGVTFGLSIFCIVVGAHLWSILGILIVVRQRPWLWVSTTSWPPLVTEHRMQAGYTFFASLLRMDLIPAHPLPTSALPRPLLSKEIWILESGKFFSCSIRNPGLSNPEYSSGNSIRIWNPILQNLSWILLHGVISWLCWGKDLQAE